MNITLVFILIRKHLKYVLFMYKAVFSVSELLCTLFKSEFDIFSQLFIILFSSSLYIFYDRCSFAFSTPPVLCVKLQSLKFGRPPPTMSISSSLTWFIFVLHLLLHSCIAFNKVTSTNQCIYWASFDFRDHVFIKCCSIVLKWFLLNITIHISHMTLLHELLTMAILFCSLCLDVLFLVLSGYTFAVFWLLIA